MPFERRSSFPEEFSTAIELSSVAVGGKVISVSDEFFAEAFHLLLVEPAPSLKGQFGPNGALYSGWESRRHNLGHDWCIIRLGTTGTISGFDIDTSNFNGNEAPQGSVEVLLGDSSEEPEVNDLRWTEILPRVDLGPNSQHFFKVKNSSDVNYVKLNMFPDGGIARFRVYGDVSPVWPSDESELFDLAHVFAGGRVDFTSDQHFGVGTNLIYPGRGKNMGDGWETKRSRQKGHKDWVIIKLGTAGTLEQIEIDTAHFKGNFPDTCDVQGLLSNQNIDWKACQNEDLDWVDILPRMRLGPHRQHYFQFENVEGRMFTHIKLTIYPDGGLQRVRVLGRRSDTNKDLTGKDSSPRGPVSASTSTYVVPVLPLTPEAFAPFGQVVRGYEDHDTVPKGTKITAANGGSATKFHKLSLLESCYPKDATATTGISIYRCQPAQPTKDGLLDLKVLERHPFTNQAFIPMGLGTNQGLSDPGLNYVVVVAKSGSDNRPDLQNLRAFIASAAEGVVYGTAVWHQPMTVIGGAMDFACVETQIGDGSPQDCEVFELDVRNADIKVKLPGVFSEFKL